MKPINHLLSWMARRKDREWKEATDYAYRHFQGQELQDFLRLINDIDDGRPAEKKVEKKP